MKSIWHSNSTIWTRKSWCRLITRNKARARNFKICRLQQPMNETHRIQQKKWAWEEISIRQHMQMQLIRLAKNQNRLWLNSSTDLQMSQQEQLYRVPIRPQKRSKTASNSPSSISLYQTQSARDSTGAKARKNNKPINECQVNECQQKGTKLSI